MNAFIKKANAGISNLKFIKIFTYYSGFKIVNLTNCYSSSKLKMKIFFDDHKYSIFEITKKKKKSIMILFRDFFNYYFELLN